MNILNQSILPLLFSNLFIYLSQVIASLDHILLSTKIHGHESQKLVFTLSLISVIFLFSFPSKMLQFLLSKVLAVSYNTITTSAKALQSDLGLGMNSTSTRFWQDQALVLMSYFGRGAEYFKIVNCSFKMQTKIYIYTQKPHSCLDCFSNTLLLI